MIRKPRLRILNFHPDWFNPQLVVGALAVSALLAGSLSAQARSDALNDDDILEAIEVELRFDEAVAADLVDVRVNAGIVTLSGDTFTLLAKRQAVRLLGSLRGVRAIVDRTKVLPTQRRDEEVFADVQAALQADPVARDSEICVQVEEGRVTLGGTVDSFPERRLAETAVAGVRGVTEISNKIEIRAKTNRPDKEIRPEIVRRFEISPFLAEGLIEIQVNDGDVTLSGVVGSVNEKSLASLLSWVAGVRSVDSSGLGIKWWLDRERRRDKFTVLRNDIELQRAVQDALLYDPRVRGTKIEVRVRQGVVSLIGRVASLSAKRAAEKDAKDTIGVRRVLNNLKVKIPDWPGDITVTKRARAALARDAYLYDREVLVASHFGTVYLSGEVDTHFEKQRAEVVVANVPGAIDLVNRVTVDARWKAKPDEEIDEDLRRRIRWSPAIDPEEITVSVVDGVVTLRGRVDTWHERRAISEHAFQVGARRVSNQIDARSSRRTPLGLKATLIPKRTEYELDPRFSSEEFRRFLESIDGVSDSNRLPAAPEIDVVLRLYNESTQPIDIRIGHDRAGIELSLTGEGAVSVTLGRAFVADFRPGRIVTIDPGKELELPISALQYGFRGTSDRWYWTKPGQYSLQATLYWPIDVTGTYMQAVSATPVSLTVKVSNANGT